MKKNIFLISLYAWLIHPIMGDSQNLKPFVYKYKWGLKDERGNIVIEAKYDEIKDFSEGIAAVEIYGNWGFIDQAGKEIVKPKYSLVRSFSEGLAVVNKGAQKGEYYTLGGKYGYIDKSGKEVIPLSYDYAENFSEGLAVVNLGAIVGEYSIRMKGGLSGYIDKTGAIVIPLRYEEAGNFKDGLAWIKIKKEYGYIDKEGKKIIPVKYEDVREFYKGVAFIKKNGKWGLVNKINKSLVDFQYDDAYNFCEDYALVKKSGECGFVDINGNEIISLKYDDAFSFNEGMAYIKIGNKCGYIDKTGKEIIPTIYKDAALMFKNGKAKVSLTGYSSDAIEIDQYGHEVKPVGKATKELPVEIKSKTHTLYAYPGWEGIFKDAEKYSDLRSYYNGKKPSEIFNEGPNGWIKDESSLYSLNFMFSETDSSTLEKEKEWFIELAKNRTGWTTEKIKPLEENIVMPDGRKGLLLFYVCPDTKGMVGGNYFNCYLYLESLKDKTKITTYKVFIEGGNPDLPQKDAIAWKDYFKKVLLTISPN